MVFRVITFHVGVTCDQVLIAGEKEGKRKRGEKIMPDTFILQAANRPHYE